MSIGLLLLGVPIPDSIFGIETSNSFSMPKADTPITFTLPSESFWLSWYTNLSESLDREK